MAAMNVSEVLEAWLDVHSEEESEFGSDLRVVRREVRMIQLKPGEK